MRTTVRSVAGSYGLGDLCVKLSMTAAFAQTGSERSASIFGASAVSMRTAITLGRTKGGGADGLALACIDALAPTSISSDGASRGGEPGPAGAGAANASPPASAQTKIPASATAPLALLLIRAPPPRGLFLECS